MRILCFIDSLGPGGAQRQLVELGAGFKEKGHKVEFLTYHDIPFYNSFLEARDIGITSLEGGNYLRRMIRVRKFIRHNGFDAVLSFLEAPGFMAEFAGFPHRRWKLVVGERRANPLIKRRLKLIFYRWFHFFADYVVSNSRANIHQVFGVNPFLNRSRCRVIYNAIDQNRWHPLPGFDFRKGPKLRLMVGASHLRRKNAEGLLEALHRLKPEERDRLEVLWYGDPEPVSDDCGAYRSAIRKMRELKLEDTISFHPASRDISLIIQKVDAVGLFSLSEGMPNIVCEGMSCGKPVICSSISDIPDILSYDRKLLFDPRDPGSIAGSLRYLIGLSKEKLRETGETNREIAGRYFRKESVLKAYLEILMPAKSGQQKRKTYSFYKASMGNGAWYTE